MSATLRPKTLGLLGIGKDVSEFREWDRVFPSNRHPIYSIPARGNDGKEIRIDRRTKDDDLLSWVEWIDRIIDGRLDRKGLIHTVSYARQQFLLDNSRHSGIMLGNTGEPDSETTVEVANRFRETVAPAILVSPSFGTGWDFPGSELEFIIISKIPFKPNNGKVAKAREQRDPQYSSYEAMQELIQGCGRGMRFDLDRCEIADYGRSFNVVSVQKQIVSIAVVCGCGEEGEYDTGTTAEINLGDNKMIKKKFVHKWFWWRNWYWGIDLDGHPNWWLIDMGKFGLKLGWEYHNVEEI